MTRDALDAAISAVANVEAARRLILPLAEVIAEVRMEDRREAFLRGWMLGAATVVAINAAAWWFA